MWCLSCTSLSKTWLCEGCAHSLTAGPVRVLTSGLTVAAAYLHQGPARQLVRALKYRAGLAVAQPLVAAMAPLIPPGTRWLVPVPRVWLRSWRYGVDPALYLAQCLARRLDIECLPALEAPWWAPPQAGSRRADRIPPAFRLRRMPAGRVVLIDDVVTTGGTLEAAAGTMFGRATLAVTATAAPATGVTSLNPSALSGRMV